MPTLSRKLNLDAYLGNRSVQTPYVLDVLSTPVSGAYSVRLLSSAYYGSAFRVRRSSDNAEQNIPFLANGDLDTTNLTTFCGSSSGFVTTWYDQSGNGKNLSQANTTLQPQVVNAGTVITATNAKPALKAGTTQYMATTNNFGIVYPNAFSYNFVYQLTSPYVVNGNIIGNDANSARVYLDNAQRMRMATPPANLFAFGYNSPSVITAIFIPAVQYTLALNGVAQTANVTIGTPLPQVNIFNFNRSGLQPGQNGLMQECFVFPSIVNRSVLEHNQGTYFNITIP